MIHKPTYIWGGPSGNITLISLWPQLCSVTSPDLSCSRCQALAASLFLGSAWSHGNSLKTCFKAMCFPRDGGFGGSTLITVHFGRRHDEPWVVSKELYPSQEQNIEKYQQKHVPLDNGWINRKWLLSGFVNSLVLHEMAQVWPFIGQSRTDPACRGCAWVRNLASFLHSRGETRRLGEHREMIWSKSMVYGLGCV